MFEHRIPEGDLTEWIDEQIKGFESVSEGIGWIDVYLFDGDINLSNYYCSQKL
jgi:hypothetical protein